MTAPTLLFVDDEKHLRHAAAQTFELADIACDCLAGAEPALARIDRAFAGVLVTDIRMPGMDGITLMRRALEIDPALPVILVTGHGDVDLAVSCIKDGAYDFLEKPWEPSRLVATVRRALDARRLTLENRALRRQVGSSDSLEARLVGRSPAMVHLRQSIRTIAATDADILITGATGTGKEVAARAIHRLSDRAGGNFVHINCAALPDQTMEIELFGHEAGAFPGATKARFGKLEHARGGILCLDEIDSMPLHLQAKLLDVLQNRAVTRLGSHDAVPLDIRVIAIAKADLETAVAEGRFRSDLYYRLNVLSVRMPTLQERADDVPRLFPVLVSEAAARYKVAAPAVSGAQLAELAARDWPGNVRELRNAADRFVLGLPTGPAPDAAPAETLTDRVADYERGLIASAMAAHGGRIKEVYETLGIGRKTLYDKMQKYGLTRARFSDDD